MIRTKTDRKCQESKIQTETAIAKCKVAKISVGKSKSKDLRKIRIYNAHMSSKNDVETSSPKNLGLQ